MSDDLPSRIHARRIQCAVALDKSHFLLTVEYEERQSVDIVFPIESFLTLLDQLGNMANTLVAAPKGKRRTTPKAH